jgi:hypothetical protein
MPMGTKNVVGGMASDDGGKRGAGEDVTETVGARANG